MMMMMMIVSLKILTRTFRNCFLYEKELSNSQKALIVKLWKDGENYRNISSNVNIPFTTISSFIATQLKTKKNRCSKKIRMPD